jgi:ketosteroid isomerase-like protein
MAGEENLAVVRRSFEALNDADLDRLFECFTDDCVFDGSRIAEGIYKGRERYRAFLQGALDTVAARHTDLELRQDGNHVLATAMLIAHGQVSGAETDMAVAYLYELRDGLIAHQMMFADVEEAEAMFEVKAAEGS